MKIYHFLHTVALATVLLDPTRTLVAQIPLTISTLSHTSPSTAEISTTAGQSTAAPAASQGKTEIYPKGIRFVVGAPNGIELVTAKAPSFLGAKSGDTLEMKVLHVYGAYSSQVIADGTLEIHDEQRYIYYVKASGKLLGWMLVMADPSNPQSGKWKVEAASHGSLDIPIALDGLIASAQVPSGSYEARELRYSLAGNTFRVIWLKSDPGGIDLLYLPPLVDFAPPQGIKAGKFYTIAEFARAAQEGEQAR